MYETAVVVGWWLAFAATHMVLSSQALRPKLIARLGTGPFMGVYSVIAFATFIPLVAYYWGHRHRGALLWAPPSAEWVQGFAMVLMAIAFVLIAASLITPAPTLAGRSETGKARGVHLVTRHALFMGLALWAAIHLIYNGFASDIAFFGGFVLFGIVGGGHQDKRRLASDDAGEYRAFCADAPFFPFTGKQTVRGLKETSKIAVIVGLAASVVIRSFHHHIVG